MQILKVNPFHPQSLFQIFLNFLYDSHLLYRIVVFESLIVVQEQANVMLMKLSSFLIFFPKFHLFKNMMPYLQVSTLLHLVDRFLLLHDSFFVQIFRVYLGFIIYGKKLFALGNIRRGRFHGVWRHFESGLGGLPFWG